MNRFAAFLMIAGIGLSANAAFARGGGMGSHGSMTGGGFHSMTGGAFGTSAASPGTNSAGTALSSSGEVEGPMSGPPLGTSPEVDREEARVNKMMSSICRGC
jgi:hypothetical protein